MHVAHSQRRLPVIESLQSAIANFQAKPDYHDRCYQLLQVRSPAQIINGLDLLAIDFNLPVTERMGLETGGAIES